MVVSEVSGSLIVREGKILMVFDEERESWSIPTAEGENGELSAETAERIAEEHTGCESEAVKYRKNLKNSFERDGEEFRLQPYSVEIEGEPESAEWKSTDSLDSHDLALAIESIAGKISEKF
ncbi:MAG: NUDIX domain-containing protein [Candidatus Nanohaloarchaea archaeon]